MTLHLNDKTHNPGGFVKVAVKHDDRRTLATSVPLMGDASAPEASWQSVEAVNPAIFEEKTEIEIHPREATMWAWDC